MNKFIALIANLVGYKPQTNFQKNMIKAHEMMKIARQDKAQGYHCAAQEAVNSAKSYRAAAHAFAYYDLKMAEMV